MKSLDILDEAIKLARKAGKVAETPLNLVRAAKAVGDLGYKRAEITGETAQSKKKLEPDSQQNTRLSELLKNVTLLSGPSATYDSASPCRSSCERNPSLMITPAKSTLISTNL